TFKSKGLDFIYFPAIGEALSQKDYICDIEPLLNYCYPFINNQFGLFSDRYIAQCLPSSLKITTASKSRKLLPALGYDKPISPGFLRLVSEEDEEHFIFEYRQLDLSNTHKYWEEITDYLDTVEDASIVADKITPKRNTLFELSAEGKLEDHAVYPCAMAKEPAADLIAADEEKQAQPRIYEQKQAYLVRRKKADAGLPKRAIIENILNIIREAKNLGIYEEVIHDVFAALTKEDAVKISRVVIDSDYRIFLPDYGSLEIGMSTLPKALFILFLRHPEGIVLKQLSDYKQELLQIYKTISNRTDLIFMSESIARLCDPSDSSVNEKLSRIREAFIRKMSDSNASNYYVTGSRGEKKRITLDRELVSMPEELVEKQNSGRSDYSCIIC
ncbi:MAG: hypothetical protein LBP72_10050, partial [Dysgonamonadaceae bacterium]|nr:hypothetical protein [Dysgonamonadaceae bacterium]